MEQKHRQKEHQGEVRNVHAQKSLETQLLSALVLIRLPEC